jgi:hypothetical protein
MSQIGKCDKLKKLKQSLLLIELKLFVDSPCFSKNYGKKTVNVKEKNSF